MHVWDASAHNQASRTARSTPPNCSRHRDSTARRAAALGGTRLRAQLASTVQRRVDPAVRSRWCSGPFVLGFSPLEWHAEMSGWMRAGSCSARARPAGGQPGRAGAPPGARFDRAGSLCDRRRPRGALALGRSLLAALTRFVQAGPFRPQRVAVLAARPGGGATAGSRGRPTGRPTRARTPRVRMVRPFGRSCAALRERGPTGAPPCFDTGQFASSRGRCRTRSSRAVACPASSCAVLALGPNVT